MQKNSLAGKVVLVTGAARRIGAEIVKTLHAAGMNVVLHYNASEEEGAKLCQALNDVRPHSAAALGADLQNTENHKVLVTKAVEIWKRLDVLVNNASRFYRTELGKTTEYAWDDLMNSNVRAPFFLSQIAAPFLAAEKGCIINISDIHAERPIPDYAVYCISKSALSMMTKVLAKELAPDIRVNAISPGAILWPEGENSLSAPLKQKIIARTLLSREGSPIDIARAVLFFVRDAEYVTGQILSIDGGRSLSG